MKFAGFCAAFAALLFSMTPAVAAAPTALDLARAPTIDKVSISRDGKHIVALASADGETVNIAVWRTDALDEKPTILGSSVMRFYNVRFLKNDRLLVDAIQPYTLGAQRAHAYRQFVTDLKGEHWKPLLPEPVAKSDFEALWNAHFNARVIDNLPLDPRRVIVEDQRLANTGDIYRVDVYSGAAERVDRGSEKFFDPVTDLTGVVRAKTELNYDKGKVYLAIWFKDPRANTWSEHIRWYAKDRVPMDVLGFDTDPGIAFVRTTLPDKDKSGIYVYDVRARKIIEPVFEHKLFEAVSLRRSAAPESYGQINGFNYEGAAIETYWANPDLARFDKELRAALGMKTEAIDWVDPGTGEKVRIAVTSGPAARIVSSSEESDYVIVSSSGPSHPADYYLLKPDGSLALLGRSRPWIDPAAIGQTKLVEYRARDGLMIPGLLSLPPEEVFGPGPYPTVILPHGGPWARDYLAWDVSGWPQYLTSHGYAVLKPEFRGSEGWGQKLWRAGDGEWGQKMQDDKDDGAKWLIEQGIADPGRIAMFGYSYGGYAALAASIRPNGLYQCVISGGGAPDLAEFKKRTFDNRFQREFQNPTVDGLDVLDHAREASIPVFLYHGNRDQIVDIGQSEKFAAELKAAGKPYKYLEIEEMGHTFVTMLPSMLETQLVEIGNFLRTDCGPGGL